MVYLRSKEMKKSNSFLVALGLILLVALVPLAQLIFNTNPALAQATRLDLTPNGVTAGTAFTITVTAFDASDNVDTGYTGIVHFTSTDTGAILPSDYTFTAGDSGIHTFSVTLVTAGNQTITVTDNAAPTPSTDTETWSVGAAQLPPSPSPHRAAPLPQGLPLTL